MKLPLYQVDAFAEAVFSGNPAAVCPLDDWLDDATLQAIAAENNLSETAFIVAENGHYRLRWFTPAAEVDLCGHATLATAHVVFRHLQPDVDSVAFETLSGRLVVTRDGDLLGMDFPALAAHPVNPTEDIVAGLGKTPKAVFADKDYMALFESEQELLDIVPDQAILARLDRRGVIVTAPGDRADFASRFFCPNFGVPEDPVCGSAHCMMTPFWAERLGKQVLLAHQVSARGGVLHCTAAGERVGLAGRAIQYLAGVIEI